MAPTSTAPAKRRKPTHALQVIFAEVSAVRRLTPTMARITFTSPEMNGFITDFPDQFATLIFPLEHQTVPQIQRGFTWEEYFAMPEDARPVARNYTVRAFRPERAEIDVDIVLHGDTGFGTRWAGRAKPGDQVAMWGPRVAFNPLPETDWFLLVADETGLPAAGAILESLPASASAWVVIEIDDPVSEQPLSSAASFEVTWLHRNTTTNGESRLLETVRSLPPFPDGVRYAWGGGEIEIMNAYGKLLRRERGMKTASISAIGYWRRDNAAH